MIVKIERDEIIDLFKAIVAHELADGLSSALALRKAHESLESFFKTNIDIQFEW